MSLTTAQKPRVLVLPRPAWWVIQVRVPEHPRVPYVTKSFARNSRPMVDLYLRGCLRHLCEEGCLEGPEWSDLV